ncbi:restriction endonuclease subunit S [Escherichia fergusonii]|uniref:restriction endonuclease subunit S n=1 Tax=Escherichia fergusonii TaxID=564 RepID=UPI0035C18D9E
MSLKNIPTNWCVTTIGDINDYKSLTFNPKSYQEDSFELYSVPSFASGSPEILLGKDIASNKQYIQFKDILLCKINPRINRVWCVKEKKEHPQIGSSEWIVIRQPLIHEGFLAYFLQTQDFRDLLCSDVSGVGGSLTRAQPKRVATYNVPIAPLPEQKIIAEKLDTLLAQVDSTKARLEQIPQILKRFRQAILAAAVSEKLVNNENNKAVLTTLGSIAEDIRYGTSKKCSESEGHTPVLRIPNIGPGYIINNNLKYANFDSKELSALTLKEGDLLLIRSNGSVDLVGKVAVISENDTQYLYAGYLIRVRLRLEKAVPKYISYCVQSPQLRQIIENIARSTSGVNNINSKELASLELPLPPISEQHEIVRRVEQLFAYADTIEKQVNNALARVNNLTQSILAKAFRGELTAQWRAENLDLISGENSAAALLEKIKAERAASGGKKASRKKS